MSLRVFGSCEHDAACAIREDRYHARPAQAGDWRPATGSYLLKIAKKSTVTFRPSRLT